MHDEMSYVYIYIYHNDLVDHNLFPKEAWYYMKDAASFKQKEVHKDKMTLKAKAEVDPGLMKALISPEDGLMRPGAMPQMQTANPGACKQLLNTLGQAPI